MNAKHILFSALLLTLFAYSYQAKYVVITMDKISYVVAETEKCFLGMQFECEGNNAKMKYYDDMKCEGEAEQEIELPCSGGFCECKGKIPSGRRIEMHPSKDSCGSDSPPMLMVLSKDEACFSFDSFGKKDFTARDFEASSKLEIKKDEFTIYGYDTSDCSGDSFVQFTGKLKTCIDADGSSVRVLSSGLSLSISVLMIAISAIASMVFMF